MEGTVWNCMKRDVCVCGGWRGARERGRLWRARGHSRRLWAEYMRFASIYIGNLISGLGRAVLCPVGCTCGRSVACAAACVRAREALCARSND